MKTLLLMSGGIESSALAAWFRPELCLTVDYGQNAADAEIETSKNICNQLGLQHSWIQVDCKSLGSGEMLSAESLKGSPNPEWWPFRNQLLITFAAAYSTKLGHEKILLGAVKSDSTHADGTAEFFELANQLLELQEYNLQVEAPAINLTSLELISASAVRHDLLLQTHSCHRGNIPCSQCRGCQKRYNILVELGIEPRPRASR